MQPDNINPNSALIWFPKICSDLPVPKTITVEYDHLEFIGHLFSLIEEHSCDPICLFFLDSVTS